MEVSEFDQKIAELEAKDKKIRAEMEPICESFLQATAQLASEWIPNKVESSVTSKPEIAKKLLSRIKHVLKNQELYEKGLVK